jgi:hypothetical protein
LGSPSNKHFNPKKKPATEEMNDTKTEKMLGKDLSIKPRGSPGRVNGKYGTTRKKKSLNLEKAMIDTAKPIATEVIPKSREPFSHNFIFEGKVELLIKTIY